VRFMGEASGADLAPGEVYALEDLWITTNFRIASRHERWRHLRTEEQWQTLPIFGWIRLLAGRRVAVAFRHFAKTQLPAPCTGLSWWLPCPLEELIPQKLRG
jgi:hypothetical protein